MYRINDERSRMYDRIIQTATAIVAIGTFIIVYNRDNPKEIRNIASENYKPNMEAILVKDEKLFGNAPIVHIPRKRTDNGNLCEKLVDINYVRKQQM